jgi:CubicO group peptidase (beta-lactamase class C family)
MITYSDNGSADIIYARVGDTGMSDVAERAGMRSFEPVPGYWGGAQITAADMARFYLGLNRNLVRPYRAFGLRLLAGITESQRWGIPQAAGRGWRIFFKGGWRPYAVEETSGPVSHQAALLRYRNGERLALAVLTEETPGDPGGYATIEQVARLLLRPPPPGALRWPPA